MNDETLRRALRMDALVVLEEVDVMVNPEALATAIAAKQAQNLVPALEKTLQALTEREAARVLLKTLEGVRAGIRLAGVTDVEEVGWLLDGMEERGREILEESK